MSNEYVVRDIVEADGWTLKRGTVVEVAYYNVEMAGFPGLEDTTCNVLSYPEFIVPTGSTEWLGDNVYESMQHHPHYVLKQPGMDLVEGSPVVLLKLTEGDDPEEVTFPLDQILSGLKMTLEQWREEIRPDNWFDPEQENPADTILYNRYGVWGVVTTKSTNPADPETEPSSP